MRDPRDLCQHERDELVARVATGDLVLREFLAPGTEFNLGLTERERALLLLCLHSPNRVGRGAAVIAKRNEPQRCLYCANPLPLARRLLRGRRGNFCRDEHHQCDLRHERRNAAAVRRALGHS